MLSATKDTCLLSVTPNVLLKANATLWRENHYPGIWMSPFSLEKIMINETNRDEFCNHWLFKIPHSTYFCLYFLGYMLLYFKY